MRSFRLCVIAILAPVALAAPPSTAPATRPFTIAKDTTVVTGPLRADGTVDYVAALNRIASAGVTADNNAAIGVLDAIGPGDPKTADAIARTRAALGMPAAPPVAHPTFLDLAAFARSENPSIGADEIRRVRREQDEVADAPWTAAQAPAAARWLASLDTPLAAVAAASKRDRFFMPPAADGPFSMTAPGTIYPYMGGVRGLYNAMKSRALLRLGSGDVDGYRADVVAMVRLARVLAQGPTLIQKLVANGCERLALSTVTAATARGALSAEQCDRLLVDLRAMPAAPRVNEAFEHAERFAILDAFCGFAVYGPAQTARALGGERVDLKPLPPGAVRDWSPALRKANAWCDRLVAAGQLPTYPQRAEAADEIIADLQALRDAGAGARAASQPVEDKFLVILVPSMGRAFRAETQLTADRDLAELALALRAHRARTGAYPATPADLAPMYFKAVPNDPFSGQPLTYRRAGDGYTLYSVGPNLTDDGGVTEGRKDDPAIRADR